MMIIFPLYHPILVKTETLWLNAVNYLKFLCGRRRTK